MLDTIQVKAALSPKLECLFTPKRYKVLYGGRNAGRSWGCARALLILGMKQPIRVLCARELQKSLDESVHRLLEDQIMNDPPTGMALSQFYTVLKTEIKGANGTQFYFEGIKNNTNKIKSYEGVDYCWVEEANKVSRRSWGILIPTIRKKGSEIWLTFNPELAEDYTYRRFVTEADPANSYVIKMTYRDNPWFLTDTEGNEEMLRDAKYDPDHYLNVWEGNCVENLEGAVYANEMRRLRADGRITNVPYDPSVPVDCFWDLGRRDKTAIWCAQRVAMQWRVIDYLEGQFVGDIGYYIKELKALEYNYGTMYLPHDGKSKRQGMKYTIEEQIKGLGMDTQIVPKLGINDGINAARLLLRQCWIDEKNCEDGLKCLRHYRYRVVDGQVSRDPDHDSKEAGWASHGADAFRYMAVMSGTTKLPSSAAQRIVGKLREVMSGGGYLPEAESSPAANHLDWMG